MSKRPNSLKNTTKKQQSKEPKQTINTVQQTIPSKSRDKAANLTTIRQTSQSSQDGKSQNIFKNKKEDQKTIVYQHSVIDEKNREDQKDDDDDEDIVYDQYNILKISGLLDAYEHFLKLLCKNGLPTGKVFDYAAQEIERYEKHKRNKELKMRAELDIQKLAKRSQLSQSPPARQTSVSPYQQKRQ